MNKNDHCRGSSEVASSERLSQYCVDPLQRLALEKNIFFYKAGKNTLDFQNSFQITCIFRIWKKNSSIHHSETINLLLDDVKTISTGMSSAWTNVNVYFTTHSIFCELHRHGKEQKFSVEHFASLVDSWNKKSKTCLAKIRLKKQLSEKSYRNSVG